MSASTELRTLLDLYFETREIKDFEQLRNNCSVILRKYCNFLFVFREQQYIEKETTKEDLYFPYLSFSYSTATSELSYENRELLMKDISKWSKNSYIYTSKHCQLYIRNFSSEKEEQDKVFNLIKRIVVFYYLNSGAKARFLMGVSQKMIKLFWRSDIEPQVYTREEAVSFLCEKLVIDAVLYAVIDEVPDKDSPVLDCLIFAAGDSTSLEGKIHKALENPTLVGNNAKKAIGRRNRTTGTYDDITYGMSTISGNHVYVDDNDEVKNHSITPEYLIVFSGENIGLSVDKIEIATTFLNSIIKTFIDFEELDFRRSIEVECRIRERKLGETPLTTRNQFEKQYITLIMGLFSNNAAMTGQFPMCLRLFRPSSKSLEKVFSTLDQENEEFVRNKIYIKDIQAACVYAFINDTTISLWKKSKVDRRREHLEAGFKQRSSEFLFQEEFVGSLKNMVDETGHATVVVPVRINEIIVGTLEFSSSSRSDLQSFVETCEEFASQCGEFYRRLELANDRGWLVRMHFLHAARHRLQHIVSRISEHSEELSEELSDLIAASVVNETGSSSEDDYLLSHDCIVLLEKKVTEAFSKHPGTHAIALNNSFSELSKLSQVSRQNFILLSEVVDALAANVRKHGFQAEGLKVFAGAKCGNVNTIVLSYRPEYTYENINRTQRVCISPMPSSAGGENGYSYGLFLLATQIRMSGGWMISHAEESDQFDQSAFGFTVVLNAAI